MPTFQYRAVQADGTMAEGQLEAAGRPDAFRQMETRGLRLISLAERAAKNVAAKNGQSTAAAGFSLNFKSQKVSAKALENFTRLLSSLLASGVPLSRALTILYKEASTPRSEEHTSELQSRRD